MRLTSRRLAVLACAFACLAPIAHAQTIATGTIQGTVTDTSGGVLSGVTVTVRNIDTNVTRELVTGPDGVYRAPALQPGTYDVLATLVGFEASPVTGIAVQVGQSVPIDVTMRPGGVAEQVTVTSEAPLVETRSAAMTNVISEAAIENLPINGRRWENFVLLSPGVTNDSGFGLVSYRGISGLYNNNMVDGVDNNQAFFSEARGRTRAVYTMSQSAIREFQVGVSNMSAEFGRAAGGTVNAVTKSGTNQAKGEIFYFLRDDAFQAREPTIVALPGEAHPRKPDERRQQFGVSAGGPVRRDRVFFFGNYDQQLRSFPLFVTESQSTFFNTCTAPAANCAAATSFFQSLKAFVPREGNNKIALAKFDFNLSHANQLSMSYNGHRWRSPNGVRTAPVQFNAASDNGLDLVTTDFFVGNLNTLLGPRALNELRVQVGRDYEEQLPNADGPGTSVTGGISFGRPNFLPRTAFPHEQRYQLLDSLSWFQGTHSLKAGVDINYVRDLQINLFQGGGTYSYTSLSNIALDCPRGATGCTPVDTGATTGRHYSNFTQAFDLNNLGGKVFFETWDYNAYVQDTWQVHRSLTVNAGVRYEYQKLPEPGGVKVDGIVFRGNPAFPQTQQIPQDANNFGPRLGVTYDVGARHDTIIRTGYGVFYGRTSNSAVANALLNNGVNAATYFFTPTTAGAPAYPGTLSAPPSIAGSRPDIQYISPDLGRPKVQMFDVTVDRRLVRDLVASVAYLFSSGRNLPSFRDVNLPAANSQITYVLDGQSLGTFPLYRTGGVRPNTAASRIIVMESRVASEYHALVLSANKRFSRGVLFNTNYTLSKSEDNGQNSATFFGGNQPYDALNLGLVDGVMRPSNFERRHRFVASFHVAPGFLHGIGLGGIFIGESGFPISSNINGNLPAAVGATSTGTNGSGGDNFAPWLGRNDERQPGRRTLDLRLSHQTRLGGRRRLSVLWEVFNVLNTVNFTSFGTTAFNVVGTQTTFNPATNVATVTLAREPSFLRPRSASNTLWGARDMQVGVRLFF